MALTFNNDLLVGASDLERAREEFPRVFFALNHQALRSAFLPIDARANKSKLRSRRWGLIAVFMATLALMIASAEVLYHGAHEELVRMIAIVGAIAGIGGVIIGVFGVMFHEKKEQWLADRLSTERLRQFHFQSFVASAQQVVSGATNESVARAFLEHRNKEYAAFNSQVVERAKNELHHVVEADDPGEGLIFPEHAKNLDADQSVLDEYFRAYTVLRFERQIGYCDFMLRRKGGFLKYAPVQQARILGAIAMSCVFAILVLHGLVFVGAIAEIKWMKGPPIHVAAIWSAIVALAARTIEEGFQPETEAERLRQYRLSLKRIFERFNSSADTDDKIKAMIDLEKLSFEEMVLFLRTNYEAKFVM